MRTPSQTRSRIPGSGEPVAAGNLLDRARFQIKHEQMAACVRDRSGAVAEMQRIDDGRGIGPAGAPRRLRYFDVHVSVTGTSDANASFVPSGDQMIDEGDISSSVALRGSLKPSAVASLTSIRTPFSPLDR